MSTDMEAEGDGALPVVAAITASGARTGSLEALPPQPEATLVIVLQHMEALDEDRLRAAASRGGHDLT